VSRPRLNLVLDANSGGAKPYEIRVIGALR
jgi:hypothetical protein